MNQSVHINFSSASLCSISHSPRYIIHFRESKLLKKGCKEGHFLLEKLNSMMDVNRGDCPRSLLIATVYGCILHSVALTLGRSVLPP